MRVILSIFIMIFFVQPVWGEEQRLRLKTDVVTEVFLEGEILAQSDYNLGRDFGHMFTIEYDDEIYFCVNSIGLFDCWKTFK